MKHRQHSSTALVIARSTLLLAADPTLAVLLPAGAAEVSDWFVRDHARDHEHLKKGWYRAVLGWLERMVLPGIGLHYAARKCILEAQVEETIAEGAEQVVVVAGGFDTLAYRSHRHHPKVRFFELDHPATQASKRHSLLEHGDIAANLVSCPIDLTQTSLAEGLREAGVERDRRTLLMAEGLLMYLSEDRVEAFIASVTEFFTGEVTLALTFMVPDAKGRRRFHNGSRLLDAWLRFEGEPFLSAFGHEQMLAVLHRHHFRRAEFWDHERLREEALPPGLRERPLALGEHICVAHRI